MSSVNLGRRKGFDPRSAANLLLDEADRLGIEVSNLSLQKLLYFAHGFSLVEDRRPLIVGHFEAWRHGPVHPLAYHAFKEAGREAISFRAHRIDPLTGEKRPLPEVKSKRARYIVLKVLVGYGSLSSGVLVGLSHAKDGPWRFVVDQSRTSAVLGMRIPNDVIAERFRQQVFEIDELPREEPYEDAPFASDRPGEECNPATSTSASSP